MLATLHGQTNAVAVLLGVWRRSERADADGTTPLQAAKAGIHPAIVAALQRYGARGEEGGSAMATICGIEFLSRRAIAR